MKTYKPRYDELIIQFIGNRFSDSKEKAVIVDCGNGLYDINGILLPNRYKNNDTIMVYRKECVQIDNDHYTIRERDII